MQQARQQSLGDLPRRTARRTPDKDAIVDGDVRLTLRRARRGRRPDRGGAGRRRPGARRPAGAAVAQLLAVRGAELRHGPRRRGPGADQLHARRATRSPSSWTTAAPRRSWSRTRWCRWRSGRSRPSGGGGHRARCVRRTGEPAPDGWPDAQEWFDHAGTPPVRRRRGRRPGAADVHLRHRVAAQGRDPDQPGAAVAVRLLRDRRLDERRRRRPAHAAALPLRAARLLPRRRRLPRRDQHHPARAGPGGDPAHHRGRTGHQVLRAADRVDLAAALPRVRRRGPVSACARATTAPRRCRSRCSRRSRQRLPGRRPVELLRPDRDGAAGHDPRARRAAHPPRLGRPRGAQRRDPDRRRRRRAGPGRAPSARSCTARRTRRWATSTTHAKTAEAFRGGWFHSGDLGYVDDDRPPVRRGPQEGHDQDRRRERRQPRGRGGDLPARRRRRGRGVRDQPPDAGSRRSPRSSSPRRAPSSPASGSSSTPAR